jgi:hypothetical protein
VHHDVDASDGLAHHADLGQLGGSTTGHLYKRLIIYCKKSKVIDAF